MQWPARWLPCMAAHLYLGSAPVTSATACKRMAHRTKGGRGRRTPDAHQPVASLGVPCRGLQGSLCVCARARVWGVSITVSGCTRAWQSALPCDPVILTAVMHAWHVIQHHAHLLDGRRRSLCVVAAVEVGPILWRVRPAHTQHAPCMRWALGMPTLRFCKQRLAQGPTRIISKNQRKQCMQCTG